MKYWEGKVFNEHDEEQAFVTGPTRLGVFDEITHYHAMYSQDGPHTATIREVGEWEEIQ